MKKQIKKKSKKLIRKSNILKIIYSIVFISLILININFIFSQVSGSNTQFSNPTFSGSANQYSYNPYPNYVNNYGSSNPQFGNPTFSGGYVYPNSYNQYRYSNNFSSQYGYNYSVFGANQYGYSNYNYNSYYNPNMFWPQYNRGDCNAVQDIIMQVAPLGCSPAVVRSDLLEEQNVPVFCKLMSINANPLIDVSRIRSIRFKGEYPKGISGVSYYPSRAALTRTGLSNSYIGSPINTGVGYLVIVLSRQALEKNMPDFIEGNITAVIDYDSESAYGIGGTSFYLSTMSDSDWKGNYRDYGFWNGKGYVRADSIEKDRASFSVYSDSERKISSVTLKEGEISRDISLSGFYCSAGLNIRLDSLDVPVESALLNINNQPVWVSKGDKIINEKCRVLSVESYDKGGKLSLSCPTQKGRIELILGGGNAQFDFGNGNREFKIGQKITGNIYLAYLGQDVYNKKYAVLVKDESSKTEKDFLEKPIDSVIQDSVSREESINDMESRIKNAVINYYKELNINAEVEVVKEGKSGFGVSLNEVLIAKDKQRNYDSILSNEVLAVEYYEKSVKEYDELYNLYPSERRIPEEDPYAAVGLYESAVLSKKFEMNAKSQEYYGRIIREYPDSNIARKAANEREIIRSYDTSKAQSSIVINNEPYFIELIDFKKPPRSELGVALLIDSREVSLGLGDSRSLNAGEIQVKEIGQSYVVLNYENIENSKKISKIYRMDLKGNIQASIGNSNVKLLNINSARQAKVAIIPKVLGGRGESSFKFRIGIEKRAIQLTPQQTKNMMNNLLSAIKMWNDINQRLGKMIKVMKTGCFATSALLTAKTMLMGVSGESIARNRLMTQGGGWYEYCENAVNKGEFQTLQQCLLNKNSEIEKDIGIYKNEIEKTNSIINNIEKITGKKGFQTDYAKVESEFKKIFNDFCNEAKGNVALPDKSNVSLSGKDGVCSWDSLTHEQRRDIMTLYNARNSGGSSVLREVSDKELGKVVLDAKTYEDNKISQSVAQERSDSLNLNIRTIIPNGDTATFGEVRTISSSDSQHNVYRNLNKGSNVVRVFIPPKKNFGSTTFSANPEIAGKEVIVEVKESSERGSFIPGEKVFGIDGKEITGEALVSVREYMSLSGMDRIRQLSGGLKNPFKNPEKLIVKYFETAPFKGLPSEIPFDVNEGWYAELQYVISGFGKPYDESGRAVNFYICNAGSNGIIEFKKSSDDICRYYNGNADADLGFPGLSSAESRRIVQKAEQAIYEASRQYGQKKVTINGKSFNTGIAFGGGEGRCTDFMSASDCNLLFNVCDPVICPSSRCDLGGRYRVDNVIQSGIAGSLALCLPNIREGIAIPLCLTGVHAGLEGYISILNSTVMCLNESLISGRNVGICDEIKSIYVCEFFWKQAAPLTNAFIPWVFEGLYGQSRGGGEYLTVQQAWQNTQGAIDWFKNNYAANSMYAFKARLTDYASISSADEFGGEICKSFISANFGNAKNVFEKMIEPDSPAQYHAWFSEDVITTATAPSTSHYKVYYHIFAGKDIGSYYNVYLRDLPDTRYSFGNQNVFSSGYFTVARGYVTRGSQVDETRDFTAPSGFKQLCVNINGKDECGFGKVSSSYIVNYLSDLYAKEQATQKITKEKECVSGTPSIYSLVNPNLQAGVESAIQPQLYSKGIIRVCASENPGKQILPKGEFDTTETNYDRWQEVGYCDDPKIRCWLDKNSVKEVVKDKQIREQIIGSKEKDWSIVDEGQFIQEEVISSYSGIAEFEIEELEISKSDDRASVDVKIKDIVNKLKIVAEKAPSNVQRARGIYLLARLYKKVAESLLPESETITSDYKNEATSSESESAPKLNDNSEAQEKSFIVENSDLTEAGKSENGGKIYKISVYANQEFKEYHLTEFDYGNQEVILSDGTRRKVGKDNEGRIVFIDLFNALGQEDRVFEFRDGSSKRNLFFNFNEKWYWSFSKDSWKNIDESLGELDEKNRVFIKGLEGKNCNEGLKELIVRVLKNEEGGWFASASLVVHKGDKYKRVKFTKAEDIDCERVIDMFS